MFATTLTTERTKLLIRKPFWIALAVLSGCTALMFGIVNTVSSATRDYVAFLASWTNASAFVMTAFAEPVLIILMIVTSAFFGMEYTWRTINLWLSRGVPRTHLFGAKLVTLFVTALLFCLLGATLVLAGNYLTFALAGTVPTAGSLSPAALMLSILSLVITFLPYLALVVLLTVLGRSSAIGIAGGLAYTLVLEGLFAFLLGRFAPRVLEVLPGTMRESMYSMIQMSADALPSFPWSAALGLLAWTAVLLGTAYAAFRQQDLTA